MKITFLTPGTGSYYCGACMRDNTLARELIQFGHDVTIAPLYLPLMLDDASDAVPAAPIFFGGINVYLQQKLAIFRKTPAALDRLFNATGLLRWAARHSHMTSAHEHGEMTLAMLHVERSHFGKEWAKLATWLDQEKPDLVCLSNALLAGFVPVLRERLHVPVLVFFQGEDSFLDGLPEPYRAQCWAALAKRVAAADARIAPSRFYANFMRYRLGLPEGAIEVVHNGIRIEGYARRAGSPDPAGTPDAAGSGDPALHQRAPVIGYLARMNRDKGLEVLVDAFVFLVRQLGDDATVLRIAGAQTAADEPLVRELQQRLAAAGLAARVRWSPNLTRDEKVKFLQGLTLFSVPAVYAEAFGLYVVEAMACGVPVVAPASSAFPEILAATGGGTTVPPRNAEALAREWQRLLRSPDECARLGRAGRAAAERQFSARAMATQFLELAGQRVPAAGRSRMASATVAP